MPLFCSTCRNLMAITTTADSFKYQCRKCMHFEMPSARDTLVYENVVGTNLTIYKPILYNAGKDPVNPKVYRMCKCGNKFARQVRLGSEMRLINTCTECSDQWLDGTRENDLDQENNDDSSDKKSQSGAYESQSGAYESQSGAYEKRPLISATDVAIELELPSSTNPKIRGGKFRTDKKSNEPAVQPDIKLAINADHKDFAMSSPPKHDNAYVWLLMLGDRYVPGVITSAYSIKRFNPDADLVVMVTNDVSAEARSTLLKHVTHLFEIPYLYYPGRFRMGRIVKSRYNKWIEKSFTKWNILALPYKKAFLLDADVIAKMPTDGIFDKPVPAAIFPKPTSEDLHNDISNRYSNEGQTVSPSDAEWILSKKDAFGAAASSILLGPNMDDYELFKGSMEDFTPKQFKNETGADEQSITYFYSIVKGVSWYSLGRRWNYIPWNLDSWSRHQKEEDPIIQHYLSKEKPWEMNKDDWPDLAEWYDLYGKALQSQSN